MALEIIKFGESEGIGQKMVKLLPTLYQGSRGPGQDDLLLSHYGITQCLAITAATLKPIRAACRWTLSVDDGNGWNSEQIDFAIAFWRFCNPIETDKKKALIHCDHGASRSSGAAVIWLMCDEGWTRTDAYLWLKEENPYCNIRQEIFDSLPFQL